MSNLSWHIQLWKYCVRRRPPACGWQWPDPERGHTYCTVQLNIHARTRTRTGTEKRRQGTSVSTHLQRRNDWTRPIAGQQVPPVKRTHWAAHSTTPLTRYKDSAPGYMSRKFETFERINSIRETNGIVDSSERLGTSRSRESKSRQSNIICMSQNFRLFHVSNYSVRNFSILLLMYSGSAKSRIPSEKRQPRKSELRNCAGNPASVAWQLCE